MEKTICNVDKDFILEAYKEACSEWKKKIKKKFPDLFRSDSYIGRQYRIGDTSYSVHLKGEEIRCIHGMIGIIISEIREEPLGINGMPRRMVELLIDSSIYKVYFDEHYLIFSEEADSDQDK